MNKVIEELRADVDDLKEEVSLLKGETPNTMSKQIATLASEVSSLKAEVATLRDTLSQQNSTILDLLKEQRELIKNLRTVDNCRPAPARFSRIFPLDSLDQLEELDQRINDDNLGEHVHTMRILLRNGSLRKNINEILSSNLIMNVNIRGISNKAALQDYKMFMEALHQASGSGNAWSENMFLEELRVSLKMAKNRVHKLTSENRRTKEKSETQKRSPEQMKFEEVFFDDDD